jgi:small subunit ribosomal protein S3
MIEREFVEQKMKEYRIQEYISDNLKNVGHSHTKLQRTPLGEKIIVFTSRPGLVVGRKGQNINKLTASLKKKFGLENPQIEISEVEDINLDAQIVAERIASSLERFGSRRFKAVMHKVMEDTMNAGALGIEIVIAGKVPSARAKSWRVFNGYLKKCGDIAKTGVRRAQAQAKLKSGVIGIKVSITPADIKLPDDVKVMDKSEKVEEEKKEEIVEKPKKKKAVKKRKDEDKAKGA